MQTEIWKALPSVTGVEVSTFGRVRILDRLISSEKYTRFIKGRILKQYVNDHGYLRVSIPVDGKWTMKSVHRIVAQTFIQNPDNLSQVNHRDCDRKNNNVDNLEWCTSSYDAKYREKYGVSRTEAQGHPLFAINLATLEVSHFRSQHEAGRALKIGQGNIGSVIRGEYKYTHGFWFVNDDDNAADAIKNKLHEISKGR